MSFSPTLPRVLQIPCIDRTGDKSNSLSVERVLKQAVELLEHCTVNTEQQEYQLIICIDDLKTMLKHID